MSSVAKHFDKVAKDYHGKTNRGFWAWWRTKECEKMIRVASLFPGMTCIELGCGAGTLTSLLLRFEVSLLVAVDISFNMLDFLKIPKVKRINADIQNISFRVPFDRVFSFGSMEFVPEPSQFLANLKQLIAPSGKAILLIPKKGFWGSLYRAYHQTHGFTIKIYSKKELENMFQANKLEVERISSPNPVTYLVTVVHSE